MRTWTIAFLMGIVVAQQSPQTPDSTWLLLLPLCLFGFIIANSAVKSLLALLLGFLWLFTYVALFSHTPFPEELEGKDLLLEGTITSIPKYSPRSSRFDFTTQLNGKPYQFRLSWYKAHLQPLQAGESWRLRIKLKRPYGVSNPGGFDYERHLYRQGISATGYVRRDDVNKKIYSVNQRQSINADVTALRQTISNALREKLQVMPHGGLIEALAIGSRDKITSTEWDVLTRTGTIHLVAISGLHIGLVAGLVFFIVRFFVSRNIFLLRYLPAQVAAAACAIIAAFLYAMLANFSIPTQRAFLMVCVVMVSLIQRRVIRSSDILALSMLLILILDPMSALDIGFWLSFGAVAIIIFSVTGRLKPHHSIINWGRIQFVIAIGMLPMALLFFQKISISAPFANLVAVPLVSFITVPTTLLGTVSLGLSQTLSSLLLYIATESLVILWMFLEWLNMKPWSVFETHAPVMWTLIPATLGVIWLLMPCGFPLRWLALILFLPMLLITQPRPKMGELRLSLIDVGQGLSVLIQTRHHSLVYDTGPRYSDSFDAGKNIIVPFLKSQGVLAPDMLIVSHGDNDHSGGATSILDQLDIEYVYTGANQKRWQHDNAIPCYAGQSWQWDGIDFEMLHPASEKIVGGNNQSCVLQVRIGEYAILLPGDIEIETENVLVSNLKDQLQSDVLIAPHHGSKTSSSPAFIEAVAPKLVLIANGYRNRYRFPHASVTHRYTYLGAVYAETAKRGAISINITETGLSKPIFWRNKIRRYWHTQ